jgi:hypothetical protein
MLIVCDSCGGDEFRVNEKMIAVCILCGNRIKLCGGDKFDLKEEEKSESEAKVDSDKKED